MTRGDILKLLGGAAALVGVVALISPPTKPVPAPAGDWRKQIPVKTGTPPPVAPTAALPPGALVRKPPPAPPKLVDDKSLATGDQPVVASVNVAREDRYVPDDSVARRFRQGYQWAERNGVDDERDCYREEGDPFTDGCLAAVMDPHEGWGRPDRRERW